MLRASRPSAPARRLDRGCTSCALLSEDQLLMHVNKLDKACCNDIDIGACTISVIGKIAFSDANTLVYDVFGTSNHLLQSSGTRVGATNAVMQNKNVVP